jgi:chromosome segregation ATPase
VVNSLSNAVKAKNLSEQIDRRLSLLQGKLNGEYSELIIPKSLTKLRLWEHAQYGIEKIGSPSSFVTSHPEHGRKIEKIAECLNLIQKQAKRPKKPNEQKLAEVNRQNNTLNESLQNCANQFVKYKTEIDLLKEENLLMQSKADSLLEQLKEKSAELLTARDEIISLRKALAAGSGAVLSNVTQVNFGKNSNKDG